ncbi:anti-sigma factor [Flavobacterium humi]|uniref:Anti-sigma factor n=1 Tax=Flavobacterium humi TaxID=2562683 RepID=A0A4Z0L6A0_9FLAO|nr:anti-sigma factor [Flavobacterium humi]TGD58036.1 anti-sigma factor [Flavobacterium humi]
MDIKEYIASGILELYVYGLLSESENREVNRMAAAYPEINTEIVAIEKSIVNLSASFSPFLSAENFSLIKSKLELKHGKIIDLKQRNNRLQYLGWAASMVLLIGIGYQYFNQVQFKNDILNLQDEKTKLQQTVVSSENQNKETLNALNVVRDSKNTVITLAGQAAAPNSFAKVYWNKETRTVYVDASGLPEPPQGKVYQVWSLKLKPSLSPTSIGLLNNFTNGQTRIFEVSSTSDAEAFGITLEPTGGSTSPTMEQLYTLGAV